MAGQIVSLSGAVLTAVCVLGLAWWCSRMLGKGFAGASQGKHIKVLEQLRVGADRYFLLVKVNVHVYFIGVSPAGVQLLAELEDTFEEQEPEENSRKFSELLKHYVFSTEKKEGE